MWVGVGMDGWVGGWGVSVFLCVWPDGHGSHVHASTLNAFSLYIYLSPPPPPPFSLSLSLSLSLSPIHIHTHAHAHERLKMARKQLQEVVKGLSWEDLQIQRSSSVYRSIYVCGSK